MRYNCTKEGMGGHVMCIAFNVLYKNTGSCLKEGPCPHKERDPRDVLKESKDSRLYTGVRT